MVVRRESAMAQLLKRLLEAGGKSGTAPASTGSEGMAAYAEAVLKLGAALDSARSEGTRAYGDLGRSAAEWSALSTKATNSVLAALASHQKQLTNSVAVHSKVEEAKSLATAAAIKHTAFYKAIAATAAGFQALGDFDFWAAAQDFTSAALWGTLAGSQVASMSGGGSRGRSGAGRSAAFASRDSEPGAMPQALAAGAASAAHPPGGHLTVAIMGDNEAGEWLAQTLNAAVETRGVQLTSTRSTRSAYAQG
ncbi:MAG: hypothetical protein KGM47_12110 [Acidobacteriota bacterium]|nr:hypothetical protein [Acidobacteriota bacterium]